MAPVYTIRELTWSICYFL